QRDSTRKTNNTILSGDIGIVGDDADNAYHVVISGNNVGAGELNGLSILDGNANGDWYVITVDSLEVYDASGGGLYNESITYNDPEFPILKNVTISRNKSRASGAGIYNIGSQLLLINVIISGNIAGSYGGAIQNYNSNNIITNTIISGNVAGTDGGGISNEFSEPILTNVTITGNVAGGTGGGMFNIFSFRPIIRNSIIYGNSNGIYNIEASYPVITNSLVQGRNSESNGNIRGDKDPLFKSPISPGLTTLGNFHLETASPVIDMGNNSYYGIGATPDLSMIKTDLDGNNRFKGTVDLGAYEYDASVLSVGIVNYTAQAEGNSAKLKWTTVTESNNKAFIISRSADGKDFKEIGSVAGAGNTSAEKNYVFYDENPLNRMNIYQLSQMDYDGYKTDVGVRTVNFFSAGSNLIKVFPNPVKNTAKIYFTAGNYNQAELTDVNGKSLQRVSLSAVDTETKIDMSSMPSGIYFIKLVGNDKVESRKVVKE
ncbi:MAG: T9SS type A sorting domain-containing protein, partial [Ginsengibacter sp.]